MGVSHNVLIKAKLTICLKPVICTRFTAYSEECHSKGMRVTQKNNDCMAFIKGISLCIMLSEAET